MYTTIDRYAAACGCCEETAGRRLKDVPYRIPTRGRGRKHVALAAAVQTLKRREIEAGAVPALVKTAVHLSDDLFIEPEALSLARQFADWLPDSAMRDRLRTAQNGFVVAVANSPLCTPTIVRNLDPLRGLFALCPPVTAWVLTGVDAPDIDRIGPAFAVSNNSAALDLYTTNMMEAA